MSDYVMKVLAVTSLNVIQLSSLCLNAKQLVHETECAAMTLTMSPLHFHSFPHHALVGNNYKK